MINVYDYLDYQKFLQEYIEDQKKERSWFSYRYFAVKVGVDHSNLVKIVQGKRHASKDLGLKLSNTIGFNLRETEYFTTLVAFSKAKTQTVSKHLIEKLISIKNVNLKKIQPHQYEYFQKWIHTAIFSLLDYYNFKGDYRKLADQLTPKVQPKEAKESIELLEKLGMVSKDENGIFMHSNRMISSGANWSSVAVQRFQEETLNLALKSLLLHPKKTREINTLTVTVSREDAAAIKEMIENLRRSVVKLVEESNKADAVYQLNLQFFPLTKPKWTWN